MKYNDNGTIKDIVIKAGDTLPVGTIVEYDGETIPEGYEEVKQIKKINTSYGDITYEKIGNLVHLEGELTGIVGQYQILTTLPLEIRPQRDYYGFMYISVTTLGPILIKTTGALQAVYHNLDGGDYVANDILKLNVTYLID